MAGTPTKLLSKTSSKKFAPMLSDELARQQARLLKALSDPTRLRILSTLSRYEGEVCVAEIAENFDLEQPSVSHHLRILRDAGLIDCRKRGLWAYYYLRPQILDDATNAINALHPQQATRTGRSGKESRIKRQAV